MRDWPISSPSTNASTNDTLATASCVSTARRLRRVASDTHLQGSSISSPRAKTMMRSWPSTNAGLCNISLPADTSTPEASRSTAHRYTRLCGYAKTSRLQSRLPQALLALLSGSILHIGRTAAGLNRLSILRMRAARRTSRMVVVALGMCR